MTGSNTSTSPTAISVPAGRSSTVCRTGLGPDRTAPRLTEINSRLFRPAARATKKTVFHLDNVKLENR